MYREEIRYNIDEIFNRLREDADSIIKTTPDFNDASKQIFNMVTTEITIRSENLMVDLYSQISKSTLESEIFQNIDNQSKFFEMNLRKEIFDKYQFNVTSIASINKGIDYKELNKIYLSLAAAAGTAAVGGILRNALYSTVNLPIAVVIAGAFLAFGGMYFMAIPTLNKSAFNNALNKFFEELKSELLSWLDEVVNYFDHRVDVLIQSL